MRGGEGVGIEPGIGIVELYVGCRMPGREFSSEGVVDLFFDFGSSEIRSRHAQLFGGVGQRRDTMIGRKGDPDISETDLVSEEVEKIGEFVVEIEGHLRHLWRIGADAVPDDVIGGKANREKVSGGAAAYVFVNHQLAGKFEFVFVGKGG